VKLLAILLSVYVLLLAVRPCCTDDCIARSPVKKELAGKTSPVEKECQGCSPFFSCGSCAGFIVAKRVICTVKLIPAQQVEHNSVYQHPHLKQIALSIWQPPQLG